VQDRDLNRGQAGRTNPSDAELVARCRAGDPQAWAALVDRFERYVYAIAVRGFRLSDDQAEEVFQEVFARTYEHLDGLRDDSAIRPFIGQLTRRLSIDQLRAAERLEPLAEGDERDRAAEDVFERLERALDVQEALATLSDECREVLERFFLRDESYSTISQSLGIAPGTIASRISRCLSKLAAEFEGRNLPARPSSTGR
jgi:RNA polymerase sigma-70 factor (ECF subfamily)